MFKRYIRSIPRAVILFLLVFGLCLAGQDNEAKQKQEEEIRNLFRKGIELFKQGKDEEAYVNLEKALQIKPSADLMNFLIYELEQNILIEMLSKGGKLRETALRIMELSKLSVGYYKESDKVVDELIAKISDPRIGFDEKFLAINSLVTIGRQAIPKLISALGDEINETLRINAMITLTKMGDAAVLPLIESLKTKNVFQKQNIIITLGNVKDRRALPALKYLHETYSHNTVIMQLLDEAIERITGEKAAQQKTSYELYGWLADLFYQAPPLVMKDLQWQKGIWHWDETNQILKFEETLDFEVKHLLSERSALTSMEINKNYEEAYIFLARTYIAYKKEAEIIYETVLREKLKEYSDEDKQRLLEVLNKAVKRLNSVYNLEIDTLYKVLHILLVENKPLLAVECLKIIEKVGKRDDLLRFSFKNAPEWVWNQDRASYILSTLGNADSITPEGNLKSPPDALYEALTYPDKRVRYEAVKVIIQWNPIQSFKGIELIPEIINTLLQEEAPWQVLLVEKDPDIRNAFIFTLKNLNCNTIAVDNPRKALMFARTSELVDFIFADFESLQEVVYTVHLPVSDKKIAEISFMNALKDDIRTTNIPIVIVAKSNDYDNVRSIYKESFFSSIIKIPPINRADVENSLNIAIEQANYKALSKKRADETVKYILEHLTSLDPDFTSIDYKKLSKNLIKVATERVEPLKKLSIIAMGHFRDKESLNTLSELLISKELSKDIRLEILRAMQKIINFHKPDIDKDVFGRIIQAIKEEDADICKFASEAVAGARLTPEQKREMIEALRK